jgi:GTP-binding protein YchF
MGIRCGIVGLPNVGKSTLFNALTNSEVDASNYPFCTIDPNIGNVTVPDERLSVLADIVLTEKIVPAFVEFVDIAGLVAGASKGEGLGNKFLGNIRETDAIVHVVRCFVNPDIIHISNQIDPVHDIEIINTELLLADIQTVERNYIRAEKKSKAAQQEDIKKKEFLKKLLQHLNQFLPARHFILDDEKTDIWMKELHLLSAKPMLYVANINEEDIHVGNDFSIQVEEYLSQYQDLHLVTICGALESELSQIDGEEKNEFLRDLKLKEPALNKLVQSCYSLLGLQTFFTASSKEIRSWPLKLDSKAPQAAGVIHTDFERGFICAEVMAYKDYVTLKGEQACKTAGKMRLEGKDYIPSEGDIIHFRFNI